METSTKDDCKHDLIGDFCSKSWVMLVPADKILKAIDEAGKSTPDIVKLRHPRSRNGVKVLFSQDNKRVSEIIKLSERRRSWFVNNSVRQNGHLYIATEINVLFLILPYLQKNFENDKVVPLEDLLVDEDYPDTQRLKFCEDVKNLKLIADEKGNEDIKAWKYNEEKTISWLKNKVVEVCNLIKFKKFKVSSDAVSKTYILSDKEYRPFNSDQYLRFTIGLLSEYISDSLSEKLFSSFGLVMKEKKTDGVNESKRKSGQPENETKKMRLENGENEEKVDLCDVIVEKQNKKIKETKREQNFAKSAAGTKSIKDFFAKK